MGDPITRNNGGESIAVGRDDDQIQLEASMRSVPSGNGKAVSPQQLMALHNQRDNAKSGLSQTANIQSNDEGEVIMGGENPEVEHGVDKVSAVVQKAKERLKKIAETEGTQKEEILAAQKGEKPKGEGKLRYPKEEDTGRKHDEGEGTKDKYYPDYQKGRDYLKKLKANFQLKLRKIGLLLADTKEDEDAEEKKEEKKEIQGTLKVLGAKIRRSLRKAASVEEDVRMKKVTYPKEKDLGRDYDQKDVKDRYQGDTVNPLNKSLEKMWSLNKNIKTARDNALKLEVPDVKVPPEKEMGGNGMDKLPLDKPEKEKADAPRGKMDAKDAEKCAKELESVVEALKKDDDEYAVEIDKIEKAISCLKGEKDDKDKDKKPEIKKDEKEGEEKGELGEPKEKPKMSKDLDAIGEEAGKELPFGGKKKAAVKDTVIVAKGKDDKAEKAKKEKAEKEKKEKEEKEKAEKEKKAKEKKAELEETAKKGDDKDKKKCPKCKCEPCECKERAKEEKKEKEEKEKKEKAKKDKEKKAELETYVPEVGEERVPESVDPLAIYDESIRDAIADAESRGLKEGVDVPSFEETRSQIDPEGAVLENIEQINDIYGVEVFGEEEIALREFEEREPPRPEIEEELDIDEDDIGGLQAVFTRQPTKLASYWEVTDKDGEAIIKASVRDIYGKKFAENWDWVSSEKYGQLICQKLRENGVTYVAQMMGTKANMSKVAEALEKSAKKKGGKTPALKQKLKDKQYYSKLYPKDFASKMTKQYKKAELELSEKDKEIIEMKERLAQMETENEEIKKAVSCKEKEKEKAEKDKEKSEKKAESLETDQVLRIRANKAIALTNQMIAKGLIKAAKKDEFIDRLMLMDDISFAMEEALVNDKESLAEKIAENSAGNKLTRKGGIEKGLNIIASNSNMKSFNDDLKDVWSVPQGARQKKN
jgi:hypothetical protein